MCFQGVSSRKLKAVTEELCGHAFSASAIGAVNKTLDATLERFANKRGGMDYNRNPLIFMVGGTGFEPVTSTV